VGRRATAKEGIGRGADSSRTIGRLAALAAVVTGVVAVVVVLFGTGGDDYTYKARFLNAAQLVKGDQIEIGGTAVGSIEAIALTGDRRSSAASSPPTATSRG